MATLHPAALPRPAPTAAPIAPGYRADLVLLPDLREFRAGDGAQGRRAGAPTFPAATVPDWVRNTVHVGAVASGDLRVAWRRRRRDARDRRRARPDHHRGARREPAAHRRRARSWPTPSRDLVKIAVIERHLGTGRIGLGFVRGFGLQRGAIASTVAHDAHNIVVVGVDDDDMVRAARRLGELGGGIVAVHDRGVRGRAGAPGRRAHVRRARRRGGREQPRAGATPPGALGCTLDAPFTRSASSRSR